MAYIDFKNKNAIIVPMLEQSIHENSITTNILLTFLFQSIEGFIRTFRKDEINKYPDTIKNALINQILEPLKSYEYPKECKEEPENITTSIKGLLGMINQKNFKECFSSAVNTNSLTISIFKKEKSNPDFFYIF